MKTYKGHTIPDGATHFSDAHKDDKFYMLEVGKLSVFCGVTGLWHRLPYTWIEDYNFQEIEGHIFIHEGNQSERDAFIDRALRSIKHVPDTHIMGSLYDNGARFTEQPK